MKKLFKPFYRQAVRYTAVLVVALYYVGTVQAQNRTYLDYFNQHVYTSVATINDDDSSANGPGYAIASTLIDANTGQSKAEIIRTDNNGAMIWANNYQAGPATTTGPTRFNHIERCMVNGNSGFLVVGSIFGNTFGTPLSQMYVAALDDNGTIVYSRIFYGARPHFLGTKGLALSNGDFVVVGVYSDSMSASGTNEIAVIRLNSSFNVVSYNLYNTLTNTSFDYDGVTSLAACPDTNQIFIVGTCNRGATANGPGVMTALLNTKTGAVIWDYNFSSDPDSASYYDAGADAIYSPVGGTSGSFWVLSNSSKQRNYCLTQLNYTTGALLASPKFTSPRLNQYGYELKLFDPTMSTAGLAIGGWRDSSFIQVAPFMTFYNTNTQTVQWHKEYNGYTNSQCLMNENRWLKMLALGQFGYFYNSIMNYRADSSGFVIVDSDTAATNFENIRLWSNISSTGATGCGYIDPSMTIDSGRSAHRHLQRTGPGSTTKFPRNILSERAYSYSLCEMTGKKATGIEAKNKVSPGIKLYPNPANNTLSLEYLFAAGNTPREVSIYDATGRKVFNEILTEIGGTRPLNTAAWPAGLYMVNITENGQSLFNSRVVITHE